MRVDGKAVVGGQFEVWCVGPDGEEKWRVTSDNLVTNEGLDHMLDVVLHAATQITTWYVIPVGSNTAADAAMTYAVPTFTEFTDYTEAARQEYVEAASSSQSVTNSASPASFSISAAGTVYGLALVGGGSAASTKGDVAGGGTLFCYSLLSTSKAVANGDTVNATYTITGADDGV